MANTRISRSRVEALTLKNSSKITLKKRGLRHHLKAERLTRIIAAARHHFSEDGYDVATLRQIAAHAGLSAGTLFNYVTDKRDLIFLVWNEEMDSLVDRCLAAPRPEQTFGAKILSMTEPQYRSFAKDAKLARILLSEIQLHSPGLHLERHLSIRQRMLLGIEGIVVGAQSSGEISLTEDPELIARLVFYTFTSALRWWIDAPQPRWKKGQQDFERILKLQMNGFCQRPIEK